MFSRKKRTLKTRPIIVVQQGMVLKKIGISKPFLVKAMKLGLEIKALNIGVLTSQSKKREVTASFEREKSEKRMFEISEDARKLFKTHPDPAVKKYAESAAVIFMGFIQEGTQVPEALEKVKKEVHAIKEQH